MNRFDASVLGGANDQDFAEGQASLDEFGFADQIAGDCELGGQSGQCDETGKAWVSPPQSQTFFVPLHYEANYQYPLIVWLHSDGFNENQVSHVMPHISTRNYLATGIRAPRAEDASGHRFAWGSSDAVVEQVRHSVIAAVTQARKKYNVHAGRIVLAGYREGGTMATRMALSYPSLFAAAISLGGQFELPDCTKAEFQHLKKQRVAMLWQHAVQRSEYCHDQMAKQIHAAASIDAQLEVRQYVDDDEMNTAVLSDLDRWVMDHVVCSSPIGKINHWDTSPVSFSDN
ncbi:phospholipase [Stieleria sp. JC731]|uniref:alpha/beta hydrolase n=1 Tax=Pirellulaceae TaxID=2691357 RepID=UPI001E5FAE29|nr:phospholipase [Stieleria sp. JC731]MCC9602958.1 phospholipase [Stieleria sp. JC731]